jgi:hypothetical protein
MRAEDNQQSRSAIIGFLVMLSLGAAGSTARRS